MSKKINIKKIRPMYTAVITTYDVFTEEDVAGTLIGDDSMVGQPKPYQTVVAVGNMVNNIKVGELVAVDFTKYAQKKHKEGSLKDGVIQDNVIVSYALNTIMLDGVEHLFLQNNDIAFIIEDHEFVEEDIPTLITGPKEIIS